MVFALPLAAPLILSYSKNMMTSRLLMLRGGRQSFGHISRKYYKRPVYKFFLLLVAPVGLLAAACAVILTGDADAVSVQHGKTETAAARLNP